MKGILVVSDWFTIDEIDEETYAISEYRHYEEMHSYLLNGDQYSLLIDTGLGIENIYEQVRKLTDNPIIAAATHIHWDHIGGHKYFPEFFAHEEEVNWLNGDFPRSKEQINAFVTKDCDLPKDFDIDSYQVFQGTPTRILKDNDVIDLGGRVIQVLHTPGHSPGHMCFYEKDRGYLFTGDLVYIGMLFANFPSTDPTAYLESVERIAALPVTRLLPSHHDLNFPNSILQDMRTAFNTLKSEGKLHHGSGIHDYGEFSIWL